MERANDYQTKQKNAILSYIGSLGGSHVTAAKIADTFKRRGTPVSISTIYRYLDKLVSSGQVKKYTLDGASGACYQYVGEHTGCREHFHLKCEGCGKLIHLQCNFLDELQRHIREKHASYIDSNKTIFYGKCRDCLGTA